MTYDWLHHYSVNYSLDFKYSFGCIFQVLKGFPECLQADICLHLNKNLVSESPAFNGMYQTFPGLSVCLLIMEKVDV